MTLLEKSTNKTWKIKEGAILPLDKVKRADITGSFLTLECEGEERLIIWAYYADNPYELLIEASEEVIDVTPTKNEKAVALEAELAPLLEQAKEEAIKEGEKYGILRHDS
jgi:hypothetical protein